VDFEHAYSVCTGVGEYISQPEASCGSNCLTKLNSTVPRGSLRLHLDIHKLFEYIYPSSVHRALLQDDDYWSFYSNRALLVAQAWVEL